LIAILAKEAAEKDKAAKTAKPNTPPPPANPQLAPKPSTGGGVVAGGAKQPESQGGAQGNNAGAETYEGWVPRVQDVGRSWQKHEQASL